jgi:transcriptional regulator with XRE-family HTH domain
MAGKPMDSDIMEDLRRRVRERHQTQSKLAKDCGVGPADLANFLQGKRSLPAFAIANLANLLQMDPARLLVYWEYYQCTKQLTNSVQDTSPKRVTGWKRAQAAYHSLLTRFPNPGQGTSPESGTLATWREWISPVLVIVGDRRETPPRSPADLLAESGAMGDLHFFPQLLLPADTPILSDKICSIARDDSLRKLLQDKNLLIIASPAANLMARAVNSGSCFSFSLPKDVMAHAEELKNILEPIKYLPDELERYGGVNNNTPEQTKWSQTRRYMIFGFARNGILDPVDYVGMRATSTSASVDYGLVSLCRHPWSDSRVAIMVAGLHGPATAAAVKLLAQKDAFKGRPLGGVFQVYIPIDAPWEERYHHLSPTWDTHEYSLSGYSDALTSFIEMKEAELKERLRFWEPDKVRALLNLIISHSVPDTLVQVNSDE